MNETRNCQNCKQSFVIEPDDFGFYEKIKVPPPTWCPRCRVVRRMVWRNERSLYRRKCNLCGQDKILMYRPDAPYVVYCRDCWLSDKWNPLAFGRDYNLGKPFFTQFNELLKVVPRPGTIQQGNNVNSEYTNRCSDNRNNYLIFNTISGENCSYGTGFNFSKECMDCDYTQKSEKCYECSNCFSCFNLLYSQECIACSESFFLSNCRNCENCFGCVNLRNKSYCIFNEQFTKEEYKEKLKQFNLGNYSSLEDIKEKFKSEKEKYILPALIEHHSTDVSGNWIEESTNVKFGFQCLKVKDGKYLLHIVEAQDVMDYSFWGSSSEKIYEAINCGRQCANLAFANECWDQVIDVSYSMNCHDSQNLFGCIGVRNKQYCILNKQYSKEEYESLVPKIVKHMDEMKYEDRKGKAYVYGDFFPGELSPFGYNETIAQEYFPLMTKEKTIESGYAFVEPVEKDYKVSIKSEFLPDGINEVEDGILKETIGCAHEGKCDEFCTKAFRITKDELQFYKQMNIPLPKLCPNCRHYGRIKAKAPLDLRTRKCDCEGVASSNGVYKNGGSHFHAQNFCPNQFESSYGIKDKRIVYCEQCYNAEVV